MMRLKFKELEHVKTKKVEQLFRNMLQGGESVIPPEWTPAMSRILSENIIVPHKTTKTTIAAIKRSWSKYAWIHVKLDRAS
jgi:hypothetical protein